MWTVVSLALALPESQSKHRGLQLASEENKAQRGKVIGSSLSWLVVARV